MCREPLVFPGMGQLKQVLDADRYGDQCNELFGELFESLVYLYNEEHENLLATGIHPRYFHLFRSDFIDDVRAVERKIDVMREQQDDISYMRWVFRGVYHQYKDQYEWAIKNDPSPPPGPYYRPVHQVPVVF